MDVGSDSEQLSRDGSSALVCTRQTCDCGCGKYAAGKAGAAHGYTQIFACGFLFCFLCIKFSTEQIAE